MSYFTRKKLLQERMQPEEWMSDKVASAFFDFWKHIFQQDLQRHAVSTTAMGMKEITITDKCTTIKTDIMIAVITTEGYLEFIKAKTVALTGIPFGFIDLTDHP